MRRRERGRGIKRVGDVAGRLMKVVERAAGRLGMVAQCRQLPGIIGPHGKTLLGRRAMPDGAEHLLAPQHQLHRTAHQPRSHDAQDLRPREHALGPKAAAQIRAADVNVLGRDAEQPGDPPAGHRHRLAGRIQLQLVSIPCRHNRVRLHCIVILRWRLVHIVSPPCRLRQSGLEVTIRFGRRLARSHGFRRVDFGPIHYRMHGLGVVGRREQHRPLRRGLERFGDHHRDRLSGIAHAVVLQQVHLEHERVQLGVGVMCQLRLVRGRHHVDHARMRARRGLVHRSHTPARNGAGRQHGIEHARRMVIGRKRRRAGRFQHAVPPGDRLADAGAHAQMRAVEGHVRHGPSLRKLGS